MMSDGGKKSHRTTGPRDDTSEPQLDRSTMDLCGQGQRHPAPRGTGADSYWQMVREL